MARREHGKLLFLDLVDRTGRIQLLLEGERAGADVDLGDVVGVSGQPMRTRRGEPSLHVEELTLLAKIRRPLPETSHGLKDTEARYRQRYLDLLMNEESRRDFEVRTRLVTAIRRYLDEHGFLEVETPALQPRYGGASRDPFVTRHNAWTRISTCASRPSSTSSGCRRRARARLRDRQGLSQRGVLDKHLPEFTMLEWYEAYADYRDTMARIEELVERAALEATGATRATFRGHEVDLKAPWRRVKLVEALEQHELWTRDADELRAWLTERGVDTSQDRDWAQLIDHALWHFVEPSLIEPTILHYYPIELSPWARTTDGEPQTVERFEYFVCGMELETPIRRSMTPRSRPAASARDRRRSGR